MNRSLTLRIFLLHMTWTVLFTVGAGWWVVRDVEQRSAESIEEWRQTYLTTRVENSIEQMAQEVARSVLEVQDPSLEPEVRESRSEVLGEAIGLVIGGMDAIEDVFVVDPDMRIVYSTEPLSRDLTYTDPRFLQLFAATEPVRRVEGKGREAKTWYVLPVYDREAGSGEAPERIGSVALVLRGDSTLFDRRPTFTLPPLTQRDLAIPIIAFVAIMAIGGVLMAGLSLAPVRRLERAMAEYRKRGFRGRVDAGRVGERGELAETVQAINELGGELEALDRRGREREQLLATLSLALEDGMIALGSDGVPKTWNRAVLRILCATAGGTEVGPTPDDELRAIEEALDRNPTLVRLSVSERRASREISLRLQDGTEAPARVTCLPFDSGPGEFGRLVLVRDLAALRRVEMHLLESSRYAVLAHLAAGLAHEIRNPLHSIGINAGVVEQYVDRTLDADTRTAMSDSLRSIQDETRRLTELLNNYLGMVRPDQSPELVDLRDLAQRVVALLTYTAGRRGVRLRIGGSDNLPLVSGSADRLQQAILNLVLNSVQALPDGGEVVIETLAAANGVEVRVSDDGPGVPTDLRDRLFSIRMTTKPGGSGLGLPLVRLIAESHGGSIRYDDRPGGGASFTLTLPTKRAAA